MKYLLDTNICIHFLRGAFNMDVKMREVGLENCAISEITLAELEYGVENSNLAFQSNQRESLRKFTEAFAGRILPIRNCFTLYAKNRVRLRRLGTPISDFDLLIGCTALESNLILVSELARIEDIQLENWIFRLGRS